MLVLTRMEDERIHIGDDITVTVLEARFRGGRIQVRLGIEAPASIAIDREEVRAKPDYRGRKEQDASRTLDPKGGGK